MQIILNRNNFNIFDKFRRQNTSNNFRVHTLARRTINQDTTFVCKSKALNYAIICRGLLMMGQGIFRCETRTSRVRETVVVVVARMRLETMHPRRF